MKAFLFIIYLTFYNYICNQFFGVVLDLTAIAVVECKHVEQCGEARKQLVTNYN